jgi:hypothetical protein
MKTYGDILAGLGAGLWPDAPEGKAPLFMWGEPGADDLADDDPDDAIEAEVEKYIVEDGPPREDGSQKWSDPETVTVAVYERKMLPEDFVGSPTDLVDHILELEDLYEYSDPDEDAKPTPAMIAAARVFLAVVREDYPVWACEQLEEFEIDVVDWRERTGR